MRNICVVFAFLCSAVLAEEARPIQVLGFADASCGAWVSSANDEAARAQYLSWFRGFVSGHNFVNRSNQVPASSMPERDTLSLYIDKYCRENPLNPFQSASFELVRELRPVKGTE